MHRLTDALLLDLRTPYMIVDVQWNTLKLDISEFFQEVAKHCTCPGLYFSAWLLTLSQCTSRTSLCR
jgi:hypothetical protein